MNRHFDTDDPRLTAYVLGELDEADRAEIEAELEQNEAARDAVAEIRVMTGLLTRELQNEPHESLTPEQRAAVLEGRRRPASSRRFGRYFALVTGTAACLALFAGVAYMSYTRSRSARSAPTMLAKGIRRETVAETVQAGTPDGGRAARQGPASIPSSAVFGEKVAETRPAENLGRNERDVAETSDFGLRAESDEVLGDALDKRLEDAEPLNENLTTAYFAAGETAAKAKQSTETMARLPLLAEVTTEPLVVNELDLASDLGKPAQPQPEPKLAVLRNRIDLFAGGSRQERPQPQPAPAPPTTVSGTYIVTSGNRGSSKDAGMAGGLARRGDVRRFGVEEAQRESLSRIGGSARQAQPDQLRSLGYLGGGGGGGAASYGFADGDVLVTGGAFRGGRELARGEEEMLREGLYEVPPDRPVRRGPAEGRGTETYEFIVDNPFRRVADAALSTFSIDVDTASYTNVRRFLSGGQLPPKPAVRIEEMVNYFEYDYPQPNGREPFSVNVEVAACPWQPEHELVRIGLKGKDVPMDDRPAANLVVLLDVSGSMEDDNKLPLPKKPIELLVGKLDELADKGNGHSAYIDSFNEARKVLMEQVGSTFFTIAKDVKIQVEFNPGRVDAYRLIGYENRVMADRDFTDDRKDAGEIGAGHTVTALYEIVQKGRGGVVPGVDALKYQKPPETPENVVDSSDLMNVKLRYKLPDENTSLPLEVAVADSETSIERASPDLKFAAAVAGFGMLLRDSDYMGDTTFDLVLDLARAGKGSDDDGYRAEFINLVKTAQALQTN